MTDLEQHVNQPGRDKLVKQVRAKINELGVEYIFFQFISCDRIASSDHVRVQFFPIKSKFDKMERKTSKMEFHFIGKGLYVCKTFCTP